MCLTCFTLPSFCQLALMAPAAGITGMSFCEKFPHVHFCRRVFFTEAVSRTAPLRAPGFTPDFGRRDEQLAASRGPRQSLWVAYREWEASEL